MKIGKKIKYLREVKKLSQQELADKLRVSKQEVSSWELDIDAPDLEMIPKISAFFDVSLDTLFGIDNNLEPINKVKDNGRENILSTLLNWKSILSAIIVTIFIIFTINSYSNNINIDQYNATFEELELQTEEINNRINFNMKNRSIVLPYPNIDLEELNEIENDLVAIQRQTNNLDVPKNINNSTIDVLLKRQDNLLHTLDKQQQILIVYSSLNQYYEKDILNERGEFHQQTVKNNIDIKENDLLEIEQNISMVSNDTLNRSFRKAVSLIKEQNETRNLVSLSIQNFTESEILQTEDEYEYLKEEILRIDNLELQNELLRLLEASY